MTKISSQPRFWPESFEIFCGRCGVVPVNKDKNRYAWYHILAAHNGSRISPTTCPKCSDELSDPTITIFH